MNPRLAVEAGDRAGEVYEVPPLTDSGEELVLGRSRQCTVRMLDRKLSRRHCRFTFEDGQLYVEDMNSRNGTLVNGNDARDKTALRHGDRVEVGSCMLVVRLQEGEGPLAETVMAPAPAPSADSEDLAETVEDDGPKGLRAPERAAEAGELGDLVGRVFAGYKVEELIHEGETCLVYRGASLEDGHLAALKILRPEVGFTEQQLKRFRRGARVAARLNHPNIVKLIKAGKHHGLSYVSTEYVAGSDVWRLVQQRGQPLPPEQSLRIAVQMLGGLRHTYKHKVVLRSVRPQNVLVTAALETKLTDFDLAKPLPAAGGEQEEDITLTDELGPFGEPDFAAPELITRPVVADHRCDIFGVGACLYYMLTGSAPFPGTEGVDNRYRAFRREVKPPRELNDAIPEPVSAIILKALSSYLDKRFQTPREMQEAIRGLR